MDSAGAVAGAVAAGVSVAAGAAVAGAAVVSLFKGATSSCSSSKSDFLASRLLSVVRAIEFSMKPIARAVVSFVKKLPFDELEKTA